MHSRVALATLAGLVALLGAGAGPVRAQPWPGDPPPRHRLSVAISGGAFVSSDWSDLVLVGGDAATADRLGRILLPDLAAGTGPFGDLAFTYWRDRLGVRFHAGYARSCVAAGAGCAGDPEGATLFPVAPADDDLDVWLLDVGAVMEFETLLRDVHPYVVLGAGVTVYDPDGGVRALTPGFVEIGGRTGRVFFGEGDAVVVVEEGPTVARINRPGLEVIPSLVLGLGTEIRLPLRRGGLGLRVEVADHIGRSPFEVSLTRLESDFGFDFDDDPDDPDDDVDEVEFDFGVIHNLRATVGLSWTVELPWGGARR